MVCLVPFSVFFSFVSLFLGLSAVGNPPLLRTISPNSSSSSQPSVGPASLHNTIASIHLATDPIHLFVVVSPILLMNPFMALIHHLSEQSSPVWPTALQLCLCPLSKVVRLTLRHSRPAGFSLSSGSWFTNYRKEQNFHLMQPQLTPLDLGPLSSAKSILIETIGGNLLLSYRFSGDSPEDHGSPLEQLQQSLIDSSARCLQDPPTPFGWTEFKSHQCLLTLVPSRLRPEEPVYLLENTCKNSPITLSGFLLQEISMTLILTYCTPVPKSIWPDISETRSGLRSDTPCSSLKERSLAPSSSRTENILSPSLSFSYMVELFEPQFQTLLYAVDKLMVGQETLFASTSKFEFIVRIGSFTAIMLFHSNTAHIVLRKNLQIYRDLKMCFISICFMYLLNLCWIDCNFEP